MKNPGSHFDIYLLFTVLMPAVLAGCGENPKSVAEKSAAPPPPEPVQITQFYASPGAVTRGEEVTVCYGVENAEQVVLEPAIKAIKPARNRCFSYAPEKTGVYKLTARGAGGEASQELAIRVDTPTAAPEVVATPAPSESLLALFVSDKTEVSKAQPVTLCYSVEGAESVTLDPPIMELAPVSRCFSTRLVETTTFELTVRAGQRIEKKKLTVVVR